MDGLVEGGLAAQGEGRREGSRLNVNWGRGGRRGKEV